MAVMTKSVLTRSNGHSLLLLCVTSYLLLLMYLKPCTGQTPSPLCQNLGAVCHARAQTEGTKYGDNQGELYDCAYRVTAVNCTEEYLCTCGYDVSRAQVQALDEYYAEYRSLCVQVSGHVLRADDGLSCRDSLVLAETSNVIQDNTLVATRDDLSVEAAVQGLDNRCPGYLNCHDNYVTQQNIAADGNWSSDMTWSFLCTASRESIACTERVLCSCQLDAMEQVSAKLAFRDIRHEHENMCLEDLTIGFLQCDGSEESDMTSTSHAIPDLEKLCGDPAPTCQERQSQRFSNFTDEDLNDRKLYATCELMKLNTACIEDLICECPGMQLSDFEQQFESVRLEYLKNCSDVEDHETRTEEIRCKDSIQQSSPGSQSADLGVILGEVESDLQITTSIEEMERMCPGYTHCIDISSSYNRRAEKELSEFDKRILVCEGSRMNILCLEDVLCACGWARQQVSRHTIRQLRHNHETYCDEDLTIGYLTCDVMSSSEQPGQLCSDFVNTCERRVVSHYKSLHSNSDDKYVSCETFKSRVQCFEDYVCSCPNQQTSALSANFDSYRTPYEAQCQDVPPHRLRAGEIYCTDQIKPDHKQSGMELGIEQGAKELSLLDLARQMDQECPGYERCFNVTTAYNLLTAQQTSLAGQLTVSCEGSRYAIICLEDALCACGWNQNESFRSLMRDLRNQHERACSQDLTIGYLECKGCVASQAPWMLAVAIILQLAHSVLVR